MRLFRLPFDFAEKFRNIVSIFGELLAPRPIFKLEDHPFSVF